MASSYRDLILKFAADTTELKKATSQMKSNLDDTAKDAAKSGDEAGTGYGKGVTSSLKSVGKKVLGALGAMFAFDKIRDFAKGAYEEARESQKVGAQTAAVIKSTGGAAKVTAGQVGKLATAISNKTGIDDESIQSGQNMLLTFTGIRNGLGKNNKIFDQSTQIMTDMSVATGKDMVSSATMLGKALNNPTKGISALTRVGVTFTDGQQKQIKALQKSGDTMGAQKIILKELKKEFGGSAAAQATAGEKLTTVWKNFQEEIGTAFLPVIDKAMNFLSQKVLPMLTKFFELMLKHKKTVLALATALGVVVGVMYTLAKVTNAVKIAQDAAKAATIAFGIAQKVLSNSTKIVTAVQWLWNVATAAWPGMLIVIGIAALIAGIVLLATKTKWGQKITTAAWKAIKAAALAVFNWFKNSFIPFFTKTIPNAWKKTWDGARAGFKAFTDFFTKTIPGAFKKVIGWIKSNWQKAVFLNPVTAAIALLIKHRAQIEAIFNKLVGWIRNTFRKSWNNTKDALVKPITLARDAIANVIGRIRTAFSNLTGWIRNTWRKGWSGIRDWMASGVKSGRDRVSGYLGNMRDRFTSTKAWVKDKWRAGWANVRDWIASGVQGGRDRARNALTSITDKFTAIRTWVRDKWRKAWASAKDWITNPIENARKAIAGLLTGKKGLSAVFRGAVSTFGRIWGGLKAAIGKPLNAVIRFINLGLIRGGINKILSALGVPKKSQIPWIAPVKYATGGPIRGRGTGTSDSELIRASRGEHMLTAREVRKLGGHRKVLAWRKAVRTGQAYDLPPGYAAGGVVRPVPGSFGRFPSYPGHTGVDFPVGMNTPVHAVMAGVIKSVRSLTYSYGRHIIQSLPIPGDYEGLYAHLNSFAVRAGQHVGAGQIIAHSDDTGNSTGPHLHFTLQHPGGNYVDPTSFLNGGVAPSGGGAGGVVSSVIGFLKGLDPVKWLTNKASSLKATILDKIGTNPLAQGLARIPLVLIQKAASYMKDKLFGSVGSGENPSGSGVERWRGVIRTALGMNHLPTTDDYVNAWLRQVQSESGGNPNAVQHGYTDVNTISGDLAKGLLQTISGTFNANAFPGHGNIFNGLDNALAAIRYAKGRYGAQGMLGVIGHGHGYDQGGWLPNGLSLAMNRTGHPEPVLTPGQFSALAGGGTLEVHFHGVIDSASAAREIDTLLRNRNRLTSGITQPSRTRPVVRTAT